MMTVFSVTMLVKALFLFALFLGIAIFCVVTGGLAGWIVGVTMIVGLGFWAWRGLRPWLRHPSP
jgi:hypothetical protein